ncbi:DUF4358 domain-containing protein [Allobaculum mucilyticum]|uniref:DUF4358 domain-containing protein n=1 Tax=Allobaculum mucilyticum TaxID=2834459 RepID=UPI001E32CDAE|nr:DUF4358 domain-containing protein [Allobaculum mucilyticum]UNT95061.1 DUF4358 domain-containing protein [Allobaculum mucilyticum]
MAQPNPEVEPSRRPQFSLFSYPVVLGILGALAIVLAVFWGSTLFSGRITSLNSFDSVQGPVVTHVSSDAYPKQDTLALRRYYGLDPNEFQNSAVYRLSNAMSARELVIVQFGDRQAAQDFESAMKERAKSQSDIFAGYAPEEAQLAENALLNVQGNYALFYVGDHPEQVNDTFMESLRN